MTVKFLPIALVCGLISVVVQLWVRSYFYTHAIPEWGILGSLPSFIAVFGFVLFIMGIYQWRGKTTGKMGGAIIAITAACLYREYESWGSTAAGNGNTFDWGDIIASLLGGVVGYIVYLRYRQTDIHSESV